MWATDDCIRDPTFSWRSTAAYDVHADLLQIICKGPLPFAIALQLVCKLSQKVGSFKPATRVTHRTAGAVGGGAVGAHADYTGAHSIMSLSLSSLRIDSEETEEHVVDPEVGRRRVPNLAL